MTGAEQWPRKYPVFRRHGKPTRKQRRAANKERHRIWAEERLADLARKRDEIRAIVRSGPHEALIRRRELFTDEEAAEELGCTVDELLRMEQEFLDPLRKKWLKLVRYDCLVIRIKNMDGLVRMKESALEAW